MPEKTLPEIKLVIPGEPEYLGLVRLASAGVAHQLQLDAEISDDLKLVATEACGKVLAHGSREICICWSWDEHALHLAVTASGDEVASIEADSADDDSSSDWEEIGLLLITSLMDEVKTINSPVGLRATKYLTVYDE